MTRSVLICGNCGDSLQPSEAAHKEEGGVKIPVHAGRCPDDSETEIDEVNDDLPDLSAFGHGEFKGAGNSDE